MRHIVLAAALLLSHAAGASPEGPDALTDALRLRGWLALRAMNCERCHGRDLAGWSAPDLVAAVRDGGRERFDRIVLDGAVERGMPGYRSQALVVAELDAIHAYLKARADGVIGVGRPSPAFGVDRH